MFYWPYLMTYAFTALFAFFILNPEVRLKEDYLTELIEVLKYERPKGLLSTVHYSINRLSYEPRQEKTCLRRF